MKTRKQKGLEAEQRQEARSKRTEKSQIKILRARPGRSTREVTRLLARIQNQNSGKE